MLKRIDASMKTSLVITKPPVWFGSKFKQRESPPTGHIQAGNGHAIRVAGPVLKVVAALDQGRAVQRALERG